jgi:two-component system chemotaxis sensor kinase CheA
VRLETEHSDEDIRQVFEFVEHDLEMRLKEPTAPAKAEAVAAEALHEAKSARPVVAEHAAADDEGPVSPDAAGSKSRAAASTIRVDLARVDRLVNMVGELVITQAMLAQQIADQQSSHRPQLRQGHEDLANYTRELQECVMAIRMQPVKSVFSRMPRLVREIAAKLGKKVKLVTSGEQTEVDKTVIEELADPLLHMIRNAIDHGVESVEKRIAAGKPEEGTVELSASQRGGNILITVGDDGAGIDRQRLRAKAVERGVISADAAFSGEEIDQLIFAPGFSTAEKVTDVSGRGVGMDVVRSNIGNLGGRIQIQSTLGRGTKFTLVLPLTLAVLDGMLVAVGSETYILPLTNIVETIRPEKRVVRQLANGSTVVAIRGEFIRLVNLGALFGLAAAIQEPWKALVVVVELDNGTKLGIVVDELIGQRQVVVKSLQENFDPVPGISGATILGTGRVALILDIEQLSRLAGIPMLVTEALPPNDHANELELPKIENRIPAQPTELALA